MQQFLGTKHRRLGVATAVAIHPDSQSLLSKYLASIESTPVQMFLLAKPNDKAQIFGILLSFHNAQEWNGHTCGH
jgi:hypothetical protein